MDRYYLMNKDRKLLEFNVADDFLGGKIEETKSYSEVRPVGYVDIGSWIENRNYAKHKNHLRKWLKEWGIDTAKGFIDITHALGINDCLWIKKTSSNLSWEDVSLYSNDFSDIAERTAFETGLKGLKLSSTNLSSPEFTSDGTCDKCWRKENGEIYLYKAGYHGASNEGKEPYSEYISSVVVKNIVKNNSGILYDLVMFKGKLCSKCCLFTSEQEGYVPFYKFIDMNRSYTINDVLKICSDLGFENEYREMMLIDSIIFNQDRHLGNFGFVVDNETFQIKRFAPLFDYNKSFLCNALDKDLDNYGDYEKNYDIGPKLGGTFIEVGKGIITPELKQNLPKSFIFPMHSKYNLPKERVDKLIAIAERNIAEITGTKIYQMQYVPVGVDIQKNEVKTH